MKMTADEKYMKMALSQAKKAYALKETPIGAIIVRTHDYDGNALPVPQVIGRGYNRRNTDRSTLSHAEITAMPTCQKLSSSISLRKPEK